MGELYFAGIDAGSTYVKVALIQGEKIIDTALANTGIDNSGAAARLLDELVAKFWKKHEKNVLPWYLKQKRNEDGGTIFKTEQLLKSMQISAGSFHSARKFLEAVGLIRTYESVAEDVCCYIYVIYSPKSPKAFFDDVLCSVGCEELFRCSWLREVRNE